MTRVFLAAGVASLALAVPAGAKPGGGHGGNQVATERGGDHGAKAQTRGGGGGKRLEAQSSSRGGGFQMRNMERPRGSSQRFAAFDRQQGRGNSAAKVERSHGRAIQSNMVERGHAKIRTQHVERQQARNLERHQIRTNRIEKIQNRDAFRNELRGNRIEKIKNREAFRNELRTDRLVRAENFGEKARGYGVGGCPPGLESKGCMPPGQAAKLLGRPLSTASRFAALSAVPISARYLYPDTNDYFYRYGDGYLYRVDRDTSLIDSLLPLAFGGYMPGSYFPSSYMNSNYYVPDYYGFNSFYPDSPYSCNRYVNGVIYQVDCATGMIDDVIPLYASGYGVGQILPAGYGYYNLPNQYRSLYYDTPDYGYWYAPGAIYQYDPSSSMITSVAALLSPGFSIGQPMPMGYDAYNVPYDYRATYYDTPTAWYRYNNGYIYQVDPMTQLVTAIVASILT